MEDTDLDGLSDWSEISSPKKRNDDIAKRMCGPYSEDYENGDPRVKQENGIVKRSSRQSAQEETLLYLLAKKTTNDPKS